MQQIKYVRFNLLLTTLLMLFVLVNGYGQTPSSTVAKMEEYVNAIGQQGFSGTVLISQDGKVIYQKGVGLASREFDIPNTPEIKFRLGSITKQFTAAAILLLQERGKLKVTDSLCQYFDKCPEAWSSVTIHHLLTHTGGVPSYTSASDYESKMTVPETVASMIDRFKDKPLEFKPGEKMVYSNSGYFLLGYIIEKSSGESYETFLKNRIFNPLNLKSSGYDHPTLILKNRASGYERNPQGEINSRYLDMMQPYAAGSLYSTVEDLFAWNEALFGGKVLSAESFAAMTKPVLNNYSYGLVTNQKFNRTRIFHGGGINGFSTFLVRYPQEKVTVAVLRNTSQGKFNPGAVADTLTAILYGEQYEVPRERTAIKVNPSTYDSYIGKYELEPNFVITITKENDKLMTQATRQPKLELFPESEIKYFLKEVDAQVTFVKKDGKVTHLILHQNGNREAKKIE